MVGHTSLRGRPRWRWVYRNFLGFELELVAMARFREWSRFEWDDDMNLAQRRVAGEDYKPG